EEVDFESASRKQLRGNIYLAKVRRVEPSLQAAFVDYGGNRHGFLAFSEIHPDYYQIPVADRQALIDEEERAARAADAEADRRAGRRAQRERAAARRGEAVKGESVEPGETPEAMVAFSEVMAPCAGEDHAEHSEPPTHGDTDADATDESAQGAAEEPAAEQAPMMAAQAETSIAPESVSETVEAPVDGDTSVGDASTGEGATATVDSSQTADNITEVNGNGAAAEDEVVESVGGADAMEEVPERMYRPRRPYK